MAYDGIQYGNRVDTTTDRKLYAKVVDNVLSSATLMSRFMGNGKPFTHKTMDYTVKITDSSLGEFFSGLEALSSAASDTTITMSYAHTAFAQPIVLPMLESFANVGPGQAIDLDQFKYDEAVAETKSRLGTACFGTGTGEQPNGLGSIVDDATDVTTIGGQSRSTYAVLKATRTASGGTLTLAKLATLDDTISASGVESESPSLHVTTKTVWSLYEQLLSPAVRAEYASVGYNALGVRGDAILKSRADLKGAAGFTALTYRGVPVIKDDKCTAQNWFSINERYIEWRGRTQVPSKYAGQIEKISLGTPSTMEGVAAAPSESHGCFMQKMQMMPNQAGMIGRIYVIGQLCTSQPRRHGRLTGVTGV